MDGFLKNISASFSQMGGTLTFVAIIIICLLYFLKAPLGELIKGIKVKNYNDVKIATRKYEMFAMKEVFDIRNSDDCGFFHLAKTSVGDFKITRIRRFRTSRFAQTSSMTQKCTHGHFTE